MDKLRPGTQKSDARCPRWDAKVKVNGDQWWHPFYGLTVSCHSNRQWSFRTRHFSVKQRCKMSFLIVLIVYLRRESCIWMHAHRRQSPSPSDLALFTGVATSNLSGKGQPIEQASSSIHSSRTCVFIIAELSGSWLNYPRKSDSCKYLYSTSTGHFIITTVIPTSEK